jgi:hypothetical protein
LTETSTRHSLLSKQKHFHDKSQTKLISNSGRLVGATNEIPINVDLEAAAEPITLRHEDSDEDDGPGLTLADIPAAKAYPEQDAAIPRRRPKRTRVSSLDAAVDSDGEGQVVDDEFEVIDSDSALSDVPEDSDSAAPPPSKRRKEANLDAEDGGDDKKKLAMDISYEGFSIYGRVLCLVIKRRESTNATKGVGPPRTTAGPAGSNGKAGLGGQAMMENFIISTQLPPGEDVP